MIHVRDSAPQPAAAAVRRRRRVTSPGPAAGTGAVAALCAPVTKPRRGRPPLPARAFECCSGSWMPCILKSTSPHSCNPSAFRRKLCCFVAPVSPGRVSRQPSCQLLCPISPVYPCGSPSLQNGAQRYNHTLQRLMSPGQNLGVFEYSLVCFESLFCLSCTLASFHFRWTAARSPVMMVVIL